MLGFPQELHFRRKVDAPAVQCIVHIKASPVYNLENPERWSHLDIGLKDRKSGQLQGRSLLGETWEFLTQSPRSGDVLGPAFHPFTLGSIFSF